VTEIDPPQQRRIGGQRGADFGQRGGMSRQGPVAVLERVLESDESTTDLTAPAPEFLEPLVLLLVAAGPGGEPADRLVELLELAPQV
jgi:hypothetical protein